MMGIHTPIIALYAGLLGLVFLYLSVQVIGHRRRVRVALGVAGDARLERAARVQANFAEYTPLILLLVWLVEMSRYPAWVVHGLGGALLVGRVVHAYGVSQVREDFRLRVTGMVLTFGALAAGAVLLVGVWLAGEAPRGLS